MNINKEKIIKDFIEYAGWWIAWEFKKHAMQDEGYFSNLHQTEGCVFMGDSRVAGGDWSKVKSRSIKNMGIGGTEYSGWSRWESLSYLVSKNFREIIIGLGGNDLGSGDSQQKILGDLQKIIFILQKYTKTRIYVHCVLPIWKHGKATNKDVVELNRLIEKMCRLNNINFIDFEDEFTKEGYINPDYLNLNEVPPALWKKYPPVHLSQAGYELWYKLLDKYFMEL